MVEIGATQAPEALLTVDRQSMYFENGSTRFFGWYHSSNTASPKDCVAVICSPLGYEYANSHRTIRELADRLAREGIPAVRFDYDGVGDSPGTDLDPDRLRCWQSNVRAALRHARDLSARTRVCLIGIRLGGTIAALVAAESPVDFLVLWNPCLNGRAYLRELRALASTAAHSTVESNAPLESAGFMMSVETIDALKSINLLESSLNIRSRTLILARDDLTQNTSLREHLSAAGIAHDYVAVSGYVDMMAEPQFGLVPEAALRTLIEWIVPQCAHFGTQALTGRWEMARPIEFSFRAEDAGPITIREELCRFGSDRHLFGIFAEAVGKPAHSIILMFNAGSVHHIGPNRVYVAIARHLAARGFASLRFDLEGIGDSVRRSPGRESHPYPDTAAADARAALDYLQERAGDRRFIALGLCSGAHTAFHAGLDSGSPAIAEIILINPLTFYWAEGMSLETSQYLYDVLDYKKSVRSWASWMKLLRGKVNMGNLLRVVSVHPKTVAKSYYRALLESIVPGSASRLSRDLNRLFETKCRITLVISEGDPGLDLMIAEAKRMAARGLKGGQIRLQTVPGADHTFSQHQPRSALLVHLAALLSRRHEEGHASDGIVSA